MASSPGRFDLQYHSSVKRYRVQSAALLAIRHAGGTVVSLSVASDPNVVNPDADDLDLPAVGPDLNAIFPSPSFALEPGSRWGLDGSAWEELGIDVAPMLTLHDFYLVYRMAFEVVAGDGTSYHLRGTGAATLDVTFSVDATFQFRGVEDHDGGGWRQYPRREFARRSVARGSVQTR